MNTPNSKLILIEDDDAFRTTASRVLTQRGFEVRDAASVEDAEAQLLSFRPRYAVLDLRLGEASGLALIPRLLAVDPECRIVVLTGYASIATAVSAIKSGAMDYLTKPVDIEVLVAALLGEATSREEALEAEPMSVRRASWEHIQRVLNDAEGNISETARRLGMHRRSLQRMLQKRPPKR
ncbi:response regulator transcription factor [Alloalcanivorax xenomutans]|uniref:response regulator transcription factor n=1 Tax=Alloalcanivorax xenomutans TaxID=1094342 RepID=UPI00292FAD22|nr:response regulator [Alloalcanivorax xenomutans]WOA29672.1 response regulator [Alloalcanivorax xenomutans]